MEASGDVARILQGKFNVNAHTFTVSANNEC